MRTYASEIVFFSSMGNAGKENFVFVSLGARGVRDCVEAAVGSDVGTISVAG